MRQAHAKHQAAQAAYEAAWRAHASGQLSPDGWAAAQAAMRVANGLYDAFQQAVESRHNRRSGTARFLTEE